MNTLVAIVKGLPETKKFWVNFSQFTKEIITIAFIMAACPFAVAGVLAIILWPGTYMILLVLGSLAVLSS